MATKSDELELFTLGGWFIIIEILTLILIWFIIETSVTNKIILTVLSPIIALFFKSVLLIVLIFR